MRVVPLVQAASVVTDHCSRLHEDGVVPRVVTSGNVATPVTLLGTLLADLPQARLHALNAQIDIPLHDGVVPETTFVGPGIRRHPRLSYVPCRLSMVPRLFHGPLAPDVVVHTTVPRPSRAAARSWRCSAGTRGRHRALGLASRQSPRPDEQVGFGPTTW